ncbi:MAG: LysR family transcriptional regulator [Halioglobus sp.]|nr:LysR family transcriptional regulator [Halioglobus sp.]|tara:strand:- start:4957 stop:5805 length:849 start_codon:yes stop_codon:yes gene_type:complete
MEWDDIRYFLTLARSGSLSAAARELGVTHVTVGRRIARLEQVHGVRLFHRRQSGYSLSAGGERLRAEAEAVERACLFFERQMVGLSDVPAGLLTVSIPESTLIDLSASLGAFMQAHPDIRLKVLATSERLDLGRLQADVALRITNAPPEQWVGRELARIPFYVYGRDDYLASIDYDPGRADWVVWESESGEAEARAYLDGLVAPSHIAMRTNSNTQLLAMLRAGAGVGLLGEPIAQRYPELARAAATPVTTMGLWLLTHADLRNAARVSCFMRFMAGRDWPR